MVFFELQVLDVFEYVFQFLDLTSLIRLSCCSHKCSERIKNNRMWLNIWYWKYSPIENLTALQRFELICEIRKAEMKIIIFSSKCINNEVSVNEYIYRLTHFVTNIHNVHYILEFISKIYIYCSYGCRDFREIDIFYDLLQESTEVTSDTIHGCELFLKHLGPSALSFIEQTIKDTSKICALMKLILHSYILLNVENQKTLLHEINRNGSNALPILKLVSEIKLRGFETSCFDSVLKRLTKSVLEKVNPTKMFVENKLSSKDIMNIVLHVVVIEEGFMGNTNNYYDLDNSFVERVCRSRMGIPLTLCAIVQQVAYCVGISVNEIGIMGVPGQVVLGLRTVVTDNTSCHEISSYLYYDVFGWSSNPKPMSYNELLQKFHFDDNEVMRNICSNFMTSNDIGKRCLRNIFAIRSSNIQLIHFRKQHLDFLFSHLMLKLHENGFNIEYDEEYRKIKISTIMFACNLGLTWFVKSETTSLVAGGRINEDEKTELIKWASSVQEKFFSDTII